MELTTNALSAIAWAAENSEVDPNGAVVPSVVVAVSHRPEPPAKDVEYAAQRLRTSGRHRRHVVFQFLGAGLLGVFVQGFTAEMLSAAPEPWVAIFYVVIGFLGIFGVFWSLIR